MLLLLSAAIAMQNPGVLTLSEPGARLPVILKQISEQTGRSLSNTTDLSNEVVCLRVKDADIQTTLNKIAAAVGGEWHEDRLVSSPVALKADREQQFAERQALLRQHLVDKYKELGFETFALYDDAAVRKIMAESERLMAAFRKNPNQSEEPQFAVGEPDERLIYRLLKSLPASQICSMPAGVRVVYSDQPNAMQRPLPSTAMGAIRAFVQEQRFWSKTMRPFMEEAYNEMGFIDEATDAPFEVHPLPEQFKVDLTLHWYPEAEYCTVELRVLDADGKVCVDASNWLGSESADYEDATDPEAKSRWPVPKAKNEPLKIPLAEEFTAIIRNSPDDIAKPERLALLPKWRSMLIDPLKNDPLSFQPGLSWIALADRLDVNFVGCSDDAFWSVYTLDTNSPTPERALVKLDSFYRADWSGDWLVVAPRSFSRCRSRRVDRNLTRSMFQRSLQTRGLTIEDAADYASAQPDLASIFWDWDGYHLTALMPNRIRNLNYGLNREFLSLLGRLPLNLRRELGRRPVQFSEFPPSALQQLADMVYNEDLIEDAEPTELLPRGIPPAGTLSIVSDERSTVICPTNAEGEALGNVMTAAQVGRTLAGAIGSANQQRAAERMRSYERYSLGTSREVTFRLDFTPKTSHTAKITEFRFVDGRRVGFSDLPSDFRSAMDTARIASEERLRNQRRIDPPSFR